MVLSDSSRLIPSAEPALPCGSRSMRSVRRSLAAREAARLTAVVVLPTPPFWFAMQTMRLIDSGSIVGGSPP